MDVPWDVSPDAYRVSRIKEGIDVLVYATGSLSTANVFASDITVILYHSQGSTISTEWVGYIPVAAEFDRIVGQKIHFKNSDAKIIFYNAYPSVSRKNDTITYRFASVANNCWFAFAGPQAGAQVQPLDHELMLITIKQLGKLIRIVINMSDETITSNIDSFNLFQKKPLLPFEAALTE